MEPSSAVIILGAKRQG